MNESDSSNAGRRQWIKPETIELEVHETAAAPNRGADPAGNPSVDCQRS